MDDLRSGEADPHDYALDDVNNANSTIVRPEGGGATASPPSLRSGQVMRVRPKQSRAGAASLQQLLLARVLCFGGQLFGVSRKGEPDQHEPNPNGNSGNDDGER